MSDAPDDKRDDAEATETDEVTDIVIDVSQPSTALDALRDLAAEGDYQDAIELGVVALERFSDASDEDRGRLHAVLATAYSCVGDLDACAAQAEAAVAAFDRAGIAADIDHGGALHILAVVHLHRGDMEAATPLLDKAAELLDAAGAGAKADFGGVLLTMAEVASATGALEEAQKLCERVISDMTSVQPASEEHATMLNRVTARAFLGLGSALGQAGQTGDAKDFLARAVEFLDAGFGHGHPEMTAGLKEVAAIYRALGDESAALVIEEELSVVAGLGVAASDDSDDSDDSHG